MKKMLRAAAFLLALTLAPVFTAGAHDNGRRHRHGRKRTTTTVHVNHRNPTPGVARRVRRGRNTTPRARRGAIKSTATVTTPRRNRAGAAHALEHGSGHGRIPARVRVRN